eukprot:6189580-Pleurochrysis_carterae.AAC.3
MAPIALRVATALVAFLSLPTLATAFAVPPTTTARTRTEDQCHATRQRSARGGVHAHESSACGCTHPSSLGRVR